jgi:hypothetical protein
MLHPNYYRMSQISFVACAAYMTDVLYYLNSLCLNSQENLNIKIVIEQVNSCVKALRDLCDNITGVYFSEFIQSVPKNVFLWSRAHTGDTL